MGNAAIGNSRGFFLEHQFPGLGAAGQPSALLTNPQTATYQTVSHQVLGSLCANSVLLHKL